MFSKIQYIKDILLHPEHMEHKFLRDLFILIFLGILMFINKMLLVNVLPAEIFSFINILLIVFIICTTIMAIFNFIGIGKDD